MGFFWYTEDPQIFPFYFEAIQPQVPHFKVMHLAENEINTSLVQDLCPQTSGFFTEGSLFFRNLVVR